MIASTDSITLPFSPPTEVDLARIRGLYDAGLFLQAYQATLSFGPLGNWQGTEALVLAGRLAGQLGSGKLGSWLLRKAWRKEPTNPEAKYYHGYSVWRHRGPYACWRWLSEQESLPETASLDIRSSWLASKADVACALRDFDIADQLMSQAVELAPDSPWIRCCQSGIWERQDRYPEAVAAAQQALAFRPWYRPAVQSLAHLLQLQGDDAGSLQLLSEAAGELEHGGVAAQLAILQVELSQYAAAKVALERFVEVSPLLDKIGKKWLAAQRCEVEYYLGNKAEAIAQAKLTDTEYFKSLVKNLEDPALEAAPQVLLDVGFVRQHHVTCGPATLAAIAKYWSMPVDHLLLADEICYDGTSHHSERTWAQKNGWVVREFSVTRESVVQLIDRGIPFTFTTVEPGSAHLQAVIGYDLRRGTMAIRDPFYRSSGEGLIDKTLEAYAAYGPRGMALVPVAEQSRLEGLDLPDAALWDESYQLDDALIRHDRAAAAASAEKIIQQAPAHRLAHEVKRRLALYDGNTTDHLAAVEALLALYSENQNLQMERLSLQRSQTRRLERLETLRLLCEKKESSPIFWRQYAQELRLDARRHDDAIWLLRRAIRRWPSEGVNYYILANLSWEKRQYEPALELYRVAACLNDKDEILIQGYFNAAHWFKQTEVALAFLQDRLHRFGKKSNQPGQTLVDALMLVDRRQDAQRAMEAALQLRPEDGNLQLFAADLYLACSTAEVPRAKALVEGAKSKASWRDWLRSAARLAVAEGLPAEAIGHWQAILERQPLALDAWREITRLTAETQGEAAALALLGQAVERLPHYYPLWELWIAWLRDQPTAVREPAIRRLIELNPDDAWAQRELGFLLADDGRIADAWPLALQVLQLDPLNPSSLFLRARLFHLEDKVAEAKQDLRQAITLSVDSDYAVSFWMEICASRAERREVLLFVNQQLVQQVTYGDGLLSFRQHARGVLEDEKLLELLQQALAARPDLWHAWSAVVTQLLDMSRVTEARQLIEQATARFPLLPRLWIDQATVCRAQEAWPAELESLENAYRINPAGGANVRALADAYQRRGDFQKAKDLLHTAVERNAMDIRSQMELADVLWQMGEKEAALERIQTTVQAEPGYEQAWSRLNSWTESLGCPDRALQTARQLTESRPGEARSWMCLARMLDAADQRTERLTALAKALELNPELPDAYDLRATTLAAAGDWDEALAACNPPVYGGQPPLEMKARRAWIVAENGDLPQAIEDMKTIVEEEPHYFWGWSRLADWYQAISDHPGYLQAAEALVKINPQYEVSLGYLGEAKLLNGDKAGAKECYRKAFDLAPEYEFAGNSLFDLELEAAEYLAAVQTLLRLRKHSESDFIEALAVQVYAKLREQAPALAAFRKICNPGQPDLGNWPLQTSFEALHEATWGAAALTVIEEHLHLPDSNWRVIPLWANASVRLGRTELGPVMRNLVENRSEGYRCLNEFFKTLHQERQGGFIKIFIQRNEAWLKQHTLTWGSALFGLAMMSENALCAQWSRDYAQREGVAPWMLVNSVESYWNVGQQVAAVKCSEYALTLPWEPAASQHKLWLAANDILTGNLPAAREKLAEVELNLNSSDGGFLHLMLQNVTYMWALESHERGARFADVRDQIDRVQAGYADYKTEPARRRIYRFALRQIALAVGTPAAWWWFITRWWKSW